MSERSVEKKLQQSSSYIEVVGQHGMFVLSYIIVFSAIDMGSFYKQGRSLKMTLPNVFLPLGILITAGESIQQIFVCVLVLEKVILFKTHLPTF